MPAAVSMEEVADAQVVAVKAATHYARQSVASTLAAAALLPS